MPKRIEPLSGQKPTLKLFSVDKKPAKTLKEKKAAKRAKKEKKG
ncbi:MAG: hypothetical protein Q8N82_04735 [Deltaproteobacteria bacterium]|nr:hypothetical protein [Deltaproteobacteria bacterium]